MAGKINDLLIETLESGFNRLEASGQAKIKEFLQSKANPDGGFRGRGTESDLYYSYFAAALLKVFRLSEEKKGLKTFLSFKEEANSFDFVHLICFIRITADLFPEKLTSYKRKSLKEAVMKYKAEKGGFNHVPGSETGNAYDTFLYIQCLDVLGIDLKSIPGILKTMHSLQLKDGSFSNYSNTEYGSVPITASVIAVYSMFQISPPSNTLKWLLSRKNGNGGFYAFENAKCTDLLSTATALFALKRNNVLKHSDVVSILDFIESCWSESGGFCAGESDRLPDLEYTYYGLLALGSL